MINKAILIGNIGQEPEIKTMQSGSKVATFSLATSESWKSKDGERKDSTEWHKIVIYNEKLIEIVEKYAHKGSKVFIEGVIKTRKYTTADGVEKYITEIILQNFTGTLRLLDSKNNNSDSDDNSSGGNMSGSTDVDDEIPF